MLCIGLMSGTSLDGIDAALVRIEGEPVVPEWSLVAFRRTPYTPGQRDEIHHAILRGGAAALCRLHARLGEWFAAAAIDLCAVADVRPRDVACIGSHGQTVWHEPPASGVRGATLQLGCAATIAERTRISVVSDFRSRDVAAGGQGAPLVPWLDRLLFAVPGRTRILLNIGGMANLTRVGPRELNEPLLAFDTGPGNALIDGIVEAATGGRLRFDRDGERAGAGTVDEALLDELMRHPFFATTPPRSTGRETFGAPYIAPLVQRRRPASEAEWNDLIATVTALTARSIAEAIRRWALQRGAHEVVVTGGGASNVTLMRMLAERVAPLPVRSGRDSGIDPDAKEAIAFAVLAWAHTLRLPGNVPEVTGASGPRVLGTLTPA
ncbi:MAG: anhydro-N-acetylmuramic acid kinase [Gemmatimonadetes bacterium]|nr:anhydro-N-acetylmuramic acid kinase [Gemmatimonadota bacterium]